MLLFTLLLSTSRDVRSATILINNGVITSDIISKIKIDKRKAKEKILQKLVRVFFLISITKGGIKTGMLWGTSYNTTPKR